METEGEDYLDYLGRDGFYYGNGGLDYLGTVSFH